MGALTYSRHFVGRVLNRTRSPLHMLKTRKTQINKKLNRLMVGCSFQCITPSHLSDKTLSYPNI